MIFKQDEKAKPTAAPVVEKKKVGGPI